MMMSAKKGRKRAERVVTSIVTMGKRAENDVKEKLSALETQLSIESNRANESAKRLRAADANRMKLKEEVTKLREVPFSVFICFLGVVIASY